MCKHNRGIVVNITLSADEALIKKARKYASKHNTSLNKMVRTFLQSVASESNTKNDVDFFLNTVKRIEGDSKGKAWHRVDIYDI